MDTFLHLLYRQCGKKLYYVEDVKNCAKHKELTVFTIGGSLIFNWKGRLAFLPLNVHLN